MMSSSGSSRSGRVVRPAIAARSSCVRCSQARYPTRSVAAKTGRPSIVCTSSPRYPRAVSACLSRRGYDSFVVAKRRDGEGKLSIGPTWESLVERQIREAMDEGGFDELPYQGERLPIEDDSAAGERALGFRVLRNAGVAPPWIEADKEVRALLTDRDALLMRAPGTGSLARPRLRRELEGIVLEVNRAIDRLNSEAPTDRQHRRPLDLREEVARLEAS